MTVETFFANFGHLADAPNGVQKLRELILQLAVQGKLVAQDPDDEPASVLLEKIEAEKMRLIKGKLLRKTPQTPISPDEKLYELPPNWEWVRFGDIAQHNAGKTLDKGRNAGELRNYITTSNLYWGYFELNNIRQMPIRDDEIEKCTAKAGDLLIVEGGEAGRAAVWIKDCEICFQNHVHRARFFCDIDPFFVYRFFEKLNFSGEINQYRKGVGISNMSGKALASIVLPLPPLEEQKRIVAKVDQLMVLCDEFEARQKKQQQGRARLNNAALDALLNAGDADAFAAHWQRICSNFDLLYDHPETIAKLRAAILQLAVQGKLVPQDPNDEPASVLLERIKAEKERLVKEKVIKAPKALPEIDARTIPFSAPTSWAWCHLGSMAEFINGDRSKNYPNKNEYVTEGIPWINTGHIEPDGSLNQREMNFISREKFDSLRSGKIHLGDLLYCLRGATFGKTAIVSQYDEGAIASSLMIIRPFEPCFIRYLYYYLVGPLGRSQIFRFDNGSAQPNLSANSVRLYVYPLPPLGEQKRIVAKVDQLMALCDELEAKLNQTQQHSEKLMEATVRQLQVA